MASNPFDQFGDMASALPPAPAPAAYGAPPPGAPNANPYGGYSQAPPPQQPPASPYGQPPAPYGAPPPAYGGAPPPPSGAPPPAAPPMMPPQTPTQTNPYAEPAPSANPFGAPAPAAPPVPPSPTPYGAPPAAPDANPYGAPPAAPDANPYGAPPAAPAANPYGAPPAAPDANPYGAPPAAPDANPFGAPAATAPAPPPAAPAADPWGAPPGGAPPTQPPPDPMLGALVPVNPGGAPPNPYGMAPPPPQPQYGAPPAADPFAVFAAAPAPPPAPVPPPAPPAPQYGAPPPGAIVPAGPPPPAAVPASDDSFFADMGFSPATQPTDQLVTDPGTRADDDKGGLPPGGEWYDAKIFTPTLGVMFFKPQELTDSLFLNTDKSMVDALDERPVVAFIVEGSSARSAGVELGHVLLKVNGIDVKNPKEASRLIKEGPRPLGLLFYVPNTDVVVAEGEHMVKYDTRDTTAPNSAKDWKPKYVVCGGIIAQPWMMNMYRSKSEYDIAVIETQARRPVSVKVKQFSLQGARIQNDWQGPQMVKYKNKLHAWKYIVILPVARNPIKISSPNLSQLKPVHEGIRRILLAQQQSRGGGGGRSSSNYGSGPSQVSDPYARNGGPPPRSYDGGRQVSGDSSAYGRSQASNGYTPAPAPLPPAPAPPTEDLLFGGPPAAAPAYGAPPPQYGAPPIQPSASYGAPPPQYGAPPTIQQAASYGAPPPPQQPPYGAPPPQQQPYGNYQF